MLKMNAKPWLKAVANFKIGDGVFQIAATNVEHEQLRVTGDGHQRALVRSR